MQGTKPQTLAYGLNDSPAGLAAWMVEKYRTWSDCNGDVEARYTKDELLTIVTIYWVTRVWLFCCNASNPGFPVSCFVLSCHQYFPPVRSGSGGGTLGISEHLA